VEGVEGMDRVECSGTLPILALEGVRDRSRPITKCNRRVRGSVKVESPAYRDARGSGREQPLGLGAWGLDGLRPTSQRNWSR
jgi:hypothetical protein